MTASSRPDTTRPENFEFAEFHETLRADVPRRARAGRTASGLQPLTLSVQDCVYNYSPTDSGIAISPGEADSGAIVRLSAPAWRSFVTEELTRYGLLYSGAPDFVRGGFEDLCHWEPTLRAVYHGRPVYDPAVALTDRNGRPLDLRRVFTAGDDPIEVAHFLRTAGYVHRRGVFTPDEVVTLGNEVDRLCTLATSDDLRSWWTVTPRGEHVVCQLKYGALASPMITDLHDDPRIQDLLLASGETGLLANLDRNEGTKIIVKHPGATEGLTDLPLHTDCGMGYHPIACQMVLVGVHLDSGGDAGGRLHMTAGSHIATTPDPAISDVADWPIVELDTRPGDCTVHYSHTLHAAPPPSGELPAGQRARRTIYACFAPPSLFEALRPMDDLVAVMQKADGVTTTVDEQLSRPTG